MNDEHPEQPSVPPEVEQIAQNPSAPEDPTPKKVTPPSWPEYSAATIGPDGKKRDANGDVVPYPQHLV